MSNHTHRALNPLTFVVYAAIVFFILLRSEAIFSQGNPPGRSPTPRASGCPEDPKGFDEWWGFGDYQGQHPQTGTDIFTLILNNLTPRQWSGWSREFRGPHSKLHGRNTIVVTVSGAETIRGDPRMMKWSVRWAGVDRDVALSCLNPAQCSIEDPEFARRMNGSFEFRLPLDAIRADSITKLVITLFQNNTYGNVQIRASIVCRP